MTSRLEKAKGYLTSLGTRKSLSTTVLEKRENISRVASPCNCWSNLGSVCLGVIFKIQSPIMERKTKLK